MLRFLTPAYIVVCAIVLAWDVFLAGKIAQHRGAPRTFAVLTAIAGLLVAPALLVEIASASLLTSGPITYVAWLWPLVIALFALQAIYALVKRLVPASIGLPIALYNGLLATAAAVRWAGERGYDIPAALQAIPAAHATALGIVTGAAALFSPFAVQLPLLSPAYPVRWRASAAIRAVFAAAAAATVSLTLVEIPPSVRAITSYRRYAAERLQEHPTGDFAVGYKVLPDLDGPPPVTAVAGDLALVTSTGADVVMVVIEPEGTRAPALEQLATALAGLRGDSALLVVAMGYPPRAGERWRRDPTRYADERMAELRRVVRRLRPDYVLPADEPYGRGARALGTLPVATWRAYLTRAAAVAHRADSTVKVAVSHPSYDARDSALYTWGAAPGSPIDAVGFALYPSFRGGFALESRTRAADRWMRASRSAAGAVPKEHWVFAAGGFPAAHGEASQAQAVWGALAWATSRPGVRGLIVADAADYEAVLGVRSAAGRVRPVALSVARARRGLRETVE